MEPAPEDLLTGPRVDPTASHYLKLLLDAVFGPENFRSEIVWKRTTAHSSANRYGPVHDVILFYSKGERYLWNPTFTPHDPNYVKQKYRFVEPGTGRRYRKSDLCAAGVRHGRSGLPWRGRDPTAKGMHWKFTIDSLEKLDAEGRIAWPDKEGGMPEFKRYLDEMAGTSVQDVWTDISPTTVAPPNVSATRRRSQSR